jgi:hypothetical protein
MDRPLMSLDNWLQVLCLSLWLKGIRVFGCKAKADEVWQSSPEVISPSSFSLSAIVEGRGVRFWSSAKRAGKQTFYRDHGPSC